MSAEANKAIVRRYIESGSRDDFAAWDELCAPEMALNVPGMPEPMRGLESIKQFTAGLHSAFSDYRLQIGDVTVEGDTVDCQVTMRGTHTGPLHTPFGVIPPTGKEVVAGMPGHYRLANGKIVEERVNMDLEDFMRQLGLDAAAVQG
jgi:predicted ester cyclase